MKIPLTDWGQFQWVVVSAIVRRPDCSLWVKDLQRKPISRFSIHGVHIARSYRWVAHKWSHTRIFRIASLSREWKTLSTGKNPEYSGSFFQKSYACYSHMEIPLTTTIKITTIVIIIRSKFFFLFIGQPTTWPANNCLQIMVCSRAMPSNCVWLQIIFCTFVKETMLFSFLRSLLRENGRSLCFPRIFFEKNKLSDRMIKQLLNLVITKINIVICQCLADQ